MKKLTIIFYGIFLLIFSIFSYIFVDPNLSYLKDIYSGFAVFNRLLTTVFYTSFVLIFFIFYGIFIYFGTKRKISLKETFILLGTTVVILFFSYPAMLSYDIFNYIATSKVLFFYHENPYVVMPIEFMRDPLLGFTHAANKLALYGPIWVLLTGIPYFLGFGSFIIALFSFKIFIMIFYFLTAFLIWKMSKSIISVILFTLNPLVIIETLISGHNDIVMIFLVFFSIFLLIKKKVFPASLFFILSIFIKYTTVFLIPIFIYLIWKTLSKKNINWENIFYVSSLLMFFGFLLSPIREEIYPWYALWFLPFSFLVIRRKALLYISISFSFGLMFRYVPFMLLGSHTDPTPIIKTSVTFIPASLVLLYLVIRRLWVKNSYH